MNCLDNIPQELFTQIIYYSDEEDILALEKIISIDWKELRS